MLHQRIHTVFFSSAARDMFRRSPVAFQRQLATKFWAPFTAAQTGPDLARYGFSTALAEIADPDTFTCVVNGACGRQPLIEDFFVALLCGFDIKKVAFFPGEDGDRRIEGHLHLEHARPFISWRATGTNFSVPFSMQLECTPDVITHLTLRAPLSESLATAGCPREIAELVEREEAMKMLTSLRRVRVKPEIITLNALRSASRTQPQWSSALGIM